MMRPWSLTKLRPQIVTSPFLNISKFTACIKDKGEETTDSEGVKTQNTTCASDDCSYAALSPVKSKEYMALYQCAYSACGCGTLGSVAKTMSFGLLLAFGAWLMKWLLQNIWSDFSYLSNFEFYLSFIFIIIIISFNITTFC